MTERERKKKVDEDLSMQRLKISRLIRMEITAVVKFTVPDWRM
jgi:hypothetical protein